MGLVCILPSFGFNISPLSRFRRTHVFAVDQDPKFVCSKIEICNGDTSKDCKRKGSKATMAAFLKLAADIDGVEIIEAECMDMCTSGPNIRLDGDDKRIFGSIKGTSKVAQVLGIEEPE